MSETTKAQQLINIAVTNSEDCDSIWTRTGDLVTDNKADFIGDGIDKKAQAKAFTKILDKDVSKNILPTDSQVMSRTGDMIDLLKTNGKVKWSSWVVTSRLVQNTSDIWKGLEVFGYKVIFPSGVIISRYALRKMLKDHADKNKKGETPLETIARCLELVGKKIDELDANDEDSVSQRLIELNVKFSEWRSA